MYTTLSHCWGRIQPVKLLQQNVGAFTQQIPVRQLSKTFREAMEISRRMGIQYIWIDSLCIIQDSGEDWNRESARMGDVYSRSYCNIAATKSNDGEGGCYTSRNLFDVRPLSILIGEMTVPVDHVIESIGSESSPLDEPDFITSPLLKRAWVVQESVLASRILHFGRVEMHWECLQQRIHESQWWRIQPALGTKLSMHKPTNSSCHALPGKDERTVWNKVVEWYSFCRMSYPENNKLIAISGVANQLCPADNYLAGLWRSELIRDLLWRAIEPCHRHTEWDTPSWAWASLDGAVLPWDPSTENDVPDRSQSADFEDAAAIVDAWVTPAGQNRFGQVKGGCIRVAGGLAKSSYQWNSSIFTSGRGHVFYDTYPLPRTVYHLPLITVGILGEPGPKKELRVGLVLARCGEIRGQYIRIGRFQSCNVRLSELSDTTICDEDYEQLVERPGGVQHYCISII